MGQAYDDVYKWKTERGNIAKENKGLQRQKDDHSMTQRFTPPSRAETHQDPDQKQAGKEREIVCGGFLHLSPMTNDAAIAATDGRAAAH